MNSTKFNSEIVSRLRAINEGSTISEPHTVLKNNGVELTGITITPAGSNVGVTIYLEDAYKQFNKGEPIESIVEKISRVASLSPPSDVEGIAEHMHDAEYIRQHLRLKVVNAETNEALLADSVYRRIEDLAAMAVIEVDSNEEGIGTIRITSNMLAELKLTRDEVMKMAMAQNDAIEYSMRSIEETIFELIDADITLDDIPKVGIPMYVITSPSKCHGAAVLASQKQLDKAISVIGEDVYVLPSSIHEVIILPKHLGADLEQLRDIVRAVNTEEVSAEDLLSNEVYEYSSRTHKLVIAGDSLFEEHGYNTPKMAIHM